MSKKPVRGVVIAKNQRKPKKMKGSNET